MTTAIIYARYSPRPRRRRDRDNDIAQADAAKNSCDVQIEDLRRYCAEHGYRVVESLIFRDDAKSGKTLKKRRGLKAAFAAARRGMVFVCRDTKRLARNMLDAFFLVRRLARRGVRFESLVEGAFDQTDSAKFGLFGIRAVMAEMERLNTSRVTRQKMLAHQAGGRRMSKIPPYGFCVDPGDDARLIPVDDEQHIVSQINTLAAQGQGLREIARTLTELGFTCRGNRWHHDTIKSIVKRAKTARAS